MQFRYYEGSYFQFQYLTHSINEQPNLCTLINKKIVKKNKNVILYQSRADIAGSVVCHLGEAHLKRKAKVIFFKPIYPYLPTFEYLL